MTIALPAPRLWTPHIWVPRVRGLSLREYLAWMSSRRMLLEPPTGPYRLAPPSQVQAPAVKRTANPGSDSVVFGAATTVGSLLVYLVTRRQFPTGAPTEESWTTIATGQFQRTTTVDENGIGAYATVVTAARTTYHVFGTTNVMYEVRGSSLVGITFLLVSDHASGTAVDLGSLGVLGVDRLAFILAGNGADGVAETVTPGVWVRDYFADRDIDSVGDTIGASGAFPQTWIGHTQGAGVAVQARVDLSVAQKYGGIAVLLA